MLRTVFYDAFFTVKFFDDQEPKGTFCTCLCFCCGGLAKEDPEMHPNEEDPESSLGPDPIEDIGHKKVNDKSNIDSEMDDVYGEEKE